jgi:histone H3/H4
MARSKQTHPKKVFVKVESAAGEQQTSPPTDLSTVVVGASAAGKTKRRWHPGTVALRQMRRLQRSTKLIIPKAPFESLVRAVDRDLHDGVEHRFQGLALVALQEATESYLDEVFTNACAISINGKSVTLKARDMRCAVHVMKQHGQHTA